MEAGVGGELLRRDAPVVPIVGVVMVLEEEGDVVELPEHLRVPRVNDELQRQAIVRQVHFLVRVPVFRREIRQLLEAHASAPQRHIGALVIKCNYFLV